MSNLGECAPVIEVYLMTWALPWWGDKNARMSIKGYKQSFIDSCYEFYK
jgi:hypothetical protein